MAISAVYKNHVDGTITLLDGTGTPVTLPIVYDDGSFSLTGLSEGMYETTTYYDREQQVSTRRTKRAMPKLSFKAFFTDLSDASNGTLVDFCLRQNKYSGNVSTHPGGATAEVYTIGVRLTVNGTVHGDGSDHVITCAKVRITSVDVAEGDPNSFSITGDVLVYATSDIQMS